MSIYKMSIGVYCYMPVYKMSIGMYYYIANKNLTVVAKNILLIAPNFSRSESYSIEVLF